MRQKMVGGFSLTRTTLTTDHHALILFDSQHTEKILLLLFFLISRISLLVIGHIGNSEDVWGQRTEIPTLAVQSSIFRVVNWEEASII